MCRLNFIFLKILIRQEVISVPGRPVSICRHLYLGSVFRRLSCGGESLPRLGGTPSPLSRFNFWLLKSTYTHELWYEGNKSQRTKKNTSPWCLKAKCEILAVKNLLSIPRVKLKKKMDIWTYYVLMYVWRIKAAWKVAICCNPYKLQMWYLSSCTV